MRRALRLYGDRPDVILALSAGECGVLAGLVGKSLGIPVVIGILSGEMVWLPEIRYGWQGTWRSRAAVRLALWLADEIVAGSEYSRAPLRTWGALAPTVVADECLFLRPRLREIRVRPGG